MMKTFFLIFILFISSSLQSQTNWFSQSSGTTNILNSTHFLNESTGFAVGELGKILKTTNGGLNWITLPEEQFGNTVGYKSVFFLDVNTGIIVGRRYCCPDGFSMKTTNGGVNWLISYPFGGPMNDMFFTSVNTGYAIGSNNFGVQRIAKSINSGNTWSSQFYMNNSSHLSSVFFTNINTGYTVGGNGHIYKTLNGGLNWNSLNSNVLYNLNSIQFLNDSIGYIACDEGKVLKTTNRGENWNMISVLGTIDNFNSLFFTSVNVGFAVGVGSTIVKTTDGGVNWESELSPSIQTLHSIVFVDINTGYAVGDGGVIIKTINGGTFIPEVNINLKVLIEGFYNPLLNRLERKDSVTLILRDAIFPYSIKDSAKALIDSLTFSGQFTFSNVFTGRYYLTVKHFNSIETWSKAGGELFTDTDSIYDYDFTTSNSQAFGNNMKQVDASPVRFAIYSGDVNQDGYVDVLDLGLVYNDVQNSVSGYVNTDLNGDDFVDVIDLGIVYNNSNNSVIKITPE